MEKYTLTNKPNFTCDELVVVDMSCFGLPPALSVGKVVGKGSEHIIDNWLIEFQENFGDVYPFHVIQVPHTFILTRAVTDAEFQQFCR